jgi:hypothetical protein
MPRPISVYVYPSASDLQSALQLSGMPNVAGYAQPDLGVVMVSIPNGPEKTLELERQIPHELAHLLLYQVGDENYDRLPGWLVEGLASLAELFTNPDYARVLESAKANGALLPIASLCGTFPDNPEGNYLAYAEAASFTRYIHQRYGTTSLQALIQAYSNGLGCQEAVESVLGQSLDILETEWQVNQLEMDLEAKGWQNLVPYLVLLGLILAVPLVIWIQFRAKRHVTTGASS